MERLQKILAEAGYGSRRKVEKLIIEGVVTVNGQVAELGQKASRFDDIRVKGEKIILQRKVYYLLNKPEGYLCTLHDPFNRPKVTDLVPQEPRVFPVGRLDADTTGALLLTNDGQLSNHLLHPRYHVEKTYLVKVSGRVKPEDIRKLEKGIMLEDGMTLPAKAEVKKEHARLDVGVSDHYRRAETSGQAYDEGFGVSGTSPTQREVWPFRRGRSEAR